MSHGRGATDDGTAVVGSLVGLVAFLAFLTAAAHLLLGLYASSTVTAVATDAARAVASRSVDHHDPVAVADAEARAEAAARRGLGRLGRRARFDWELAGDTVRLRVRVDRVAGGLPGLGAPRGVDHLDRTVVLHVEEAA